MPGDPDLFDQVIPEGANVKLCEELFVPLEEAEHKYVDRESGYCECPLNLLSSQPVFQTQSDSEYQFSTTSLWIRSIKASDSD